MMLSIIVSCSLLISLNGAFTKGDSHFDYRIVGGHAISIQQAPYMAAFEVSGRQVCGASIISNYFVVTAAHCSYFTPANLVSIRVGSTNRSSGGSVHQASQIINHENYTFRPYPNYDISLVKVATPFVYSATVRPVSLASSVPADGTSVVTSGWGTTSEQEDTLSNILLQVELYIANEAECNNTYTSLITSAMLCAGAPQGGRDSCENDSGGPLVAGDQLVGVVSFGSGCGRVGYPGVYASVPFLRPWIREHTGV